MLFSLLAHVALLLAAPTSDSTRLCVVDAATRAPMTGVRMTTSVDSARIVLDQCVTVQSGTVRLQRVGYRPRRVDIPLGTTAIVVALDPLARPAQRLPMQNVVSTRTDRSGNAASTGRMTATQTVADASAIGIGTINGLIATLPFTGIRSARGETGLTLRGARREQIAITLDGMPLNDPATGIADVSDVPLAGLASATVVLGADPLGTGPGAAGGVLALESAPQRLVALRLGAFGERSIEGAWRVKSKIALWNASASLHRAENNFDFDNTASVTATAQRERRINNDEARVSFAAGMLAAQTQLAVLASTSERGMVGAENVHTYDADRARTSRVLLRMQQTIGNVQLLAGVRTLSLAYTDPTRPTLNSTARATAGDLEVRGAAYHLAWRIGAGADGVYATGGVRQSRGRAFAVADYAHHSANNSLDVGARLDAIGAYGTLPSFSIGGDHVLLGARTSPSRVTINGRLSQALRVPTLYDLYFSSPQRLFVRALRPEHVTLDAEVGARVDLPTVLGALELQSSVVTRDTRDAIIWFPGNFGWSPANVGVERLRGLEARAQMHRAWGEYSAWITAYNAALTTGPLRIPAPYVSRVAGGGHVLVMAASFTASALVRGMGRRPFTAGPPDAAFELPKVLLLDLAISRRLRLRGNELLLALSLDNATDVHWQSVRGFPSPGRGWAFSTTLRQLPTP